MSFFLSVRQTPRPPTGRTLFPYTTLFRSIEVGTTIASATAADREIPITYTVPSTAAQDFTIAAPATGLSANPVPMAFQHMLSKIEVTVKLATSLTNNYTLSDDYEATLSVLSTTGTIDAVSATASLSATTPVSPWTVTTGTALTDYTDALEFIILPQPTYHAADTTLSTKLQITNVTIKTNTSSSTSFFTGVLKPIVFTDSTIAGGAFFPGNLYNIIVTITDVADGGTPEDPDNPIFNGLIQISSSIASWDSSTDAIDAAGAVSTD